MKKFVLLFIFSYCCFFTDAQLLPSHRYTSKDGLIADRITAIQQDERGVMWFGSYFGLGSYDGIRFQKVTLPFEQQNKYVTALLPVKNKVYAGFLFGGGLAEFANGKVTAYSILKTYPHTSDDVSALGSFDDSTILVANGQNEIYRFQNGKFTLLITLSERISSHGIFHLQMDPSGNLWVGTHQGLFIFPQCGMKGMLSFFKNHDIVSLLQSENGKIWMSVNDGLKGSIFQCDGIGDNELLNLTHMATIPDLRNARFRGNLMRGFWAIDNRMGLLNINSSKQVTKFPLPLVLGSDIKTIFVDRERNLWIANDPGLTKVSNFSSVSWKFNESAAAGGFVVRDSNGIVWVNNAKALYRIENDSMQKVEFREKEQGYIGKMLLDSAQNLWLVRWNEGIWKTRWKGNKLIERRYLNNFQGQKVIGGALDPDPYGSIWLAGGNGVFRVKNNVVRERFTPMGRNGSPLFINVIIADPRENVLWLGDNSGGVAKARYSIHDRDRYQLIIEKYFGTEEGLTDPYVRSMLLDHQGNLWIGTRAGGLYRLNTTEKNQRIESIGPHPPIHCSRITALVEEKKDAIWFATCDGIYRFDPKNMNWKHFNVSDGIPSAEVFHMSIDADRQKAWVMTEEGITRIDYSSSTGQTVQPLVHLTEVNVLGKPDTTALYDQGIRRYEYGYNSIGFEYAGSSFYNEKMNVYKYMLEGFDENWSEPVATNAVNYASLAPGRYTFKVHAANAKGIWSQTPATFTFQIIIPFYRRPWFIFACIAVAATLLYLVRIERLQHKYKVEKIRMRIARDLHDDIGSALGSINLMSETAHRRLDKTQSNVEVAGMFTRIGHSAQTTLESMDDIIWSINPEKDKLGDLVIRMREFAIPLLEAKEIAFDFQVNAEDCKKLPMNLRKNIFLIFKEAIFNIVKHAESTRVLIITEVRNNIFHLQVKDNGKGFDLVIPSQRNGLKNMKKRSEMVGGMLRIDSIKEIGTTLDFRCLIK